MHSDIKVHKNTDKKTPFNNPFDYMTDCRTFLIMNASHVKKTPAMTIKSSHSLLLCAIKQAELLHIHQHEYKHATHFHSMHVTHKSSTPLQVYHLTVCVRCRRRCCCCVPQTGNGQKALMIGLIHGRMWSRVFSLDLSTVRKL